MWDLLWRAIVRLSGSERGFQRPQRVFTMLGWTPRTNLRGDHAKMSIEFWPLFLSVDHSPWIVLGASIALLDANYLRVSK